MPDVFLVVGEQNGHSDVDVEAGVRFEHGIRSVEEAVAELEDLLSNSVYETAYDEADIRDFVRGAKFVIAQVEEFHQ